MKRTIIGGFLSLIGTIWGLAIVVFTGNNMTSSWSSPPGRFLTTIAETGMTFPTVLAFLLLGLGLVVMAVEYFRKEK